GTTLFRVNKIFGGPLPPFPGLKSMQERPHPEQTSFRESSLETEIKTEGNLFWEKCLLTLQSNLCKK
ncbi:hypothetical protein, partial [Alistipes indistinctus]|uniref:hypothetical protein n=1 Tax=Alistipes indistinctus TaxID=626932 RepID=UPI003F0CB703